jgi:hypothetical protein
VQDRRNDTHGHHPMLDEGYPEQDVRGTKKKMSAGANDMPLHAFG